MPSDLKDGDLRGPARLGGTPNQHLVSQDLDSTELPLTKNAVLSIASFGMGEIEFRFPQKKGPQTKVKVFADDKIYLFGDETPYKIVGVRYDQKVLVIEHGKNLDDDDSKPVDWFTVRNLNPFIRLYKGQTVYLMGESKPFHVERFTSAKTMIVSGRQWDRGLKRWVPDVRHVPWQDVRDLGLRFSISRT